MRALSLSKGEKLGPIAGAERLGEVVARKALRRAGDSEKRARERTNIGLTLTSLKAPTLVNLHLVINGPNEFAKDHQTRERVSNRHGFLWCAC
jgi:hypothetical protein